MSALGNLREKAVEWAVMAALVGVIGYLVGNSDATMMRAEIDRLKAEELRHEAAIGDLNNDIDNLGPRVLTLEVQAANARDDRMKGEAK